MKNQTEGKRDFGCPCGKTYLSYPALFTHVKQKHNGKVNLKITQPPGKLTKPKKEKPRGRPKIHVDVNCFLLRLEKTKCQIQHLISKKKFKNCWKMFKSSTKILSKHRKVFELASIWPLPFYLNFLTFMMPEKLF